MLQNPKKFGAFGADLTNNQWFYTSCWASTAGGGTFLSFLHRFVTILHSKTLFFNAKRRIQVPNPQNFRLRRTGQNFTPHLTGKKAPPSYKSGTN